MAPETRDALDERVLILAPVGRDASMTRSILKRVGIASKVCADIDVLCGEAARGAGALVITDEALAHAAFPRLLSLLEKQPPWSDLPIVVCTHGREVTRGGSLRLRALEAVGNVSLLERPIRIRTLVSVARAAIRARHRQYEVRDLMGELAAGIRQREEANRAKDEFLAVVSHELRTPLNAILGWAQMLRAPNLDASRQRRGVETIERNARVQTQLIEDLLDVSRITSGKLRLNHAIVDMNQVIAAAVDTVRSEAEARAIKLGVSLSADAIRVTGDADRLQQVVWNLVANAVKFTPSGGRVEVGLRREGPQVVITVEDTGAGINPEFLPHIFERFRQAETGTTRSIGGLGLGLAIVKSLVELHGGAVSAESAGKGRGSTFRVTIPVAGAGPSEASGSVVPEFEPPPEMTPDLAPSLGGARVLVIDDEEDARELLRSILEDHDVVVDTAGSAGKGFEILQRSAPDVIVSDIGMPEEDGYTFMQRVRKLPPDRGGQVPAVALTAYTRVEDRTRALLAGFNVHLAKPVDATELLVLVANLCGRLTRTSP